MLRYEWLQVTMIMILNNSNSNTTDTFGGSFFAISLLLLLSIAKVYTLNTMGWATQISKKQQQQQPG